MASCLLVRSIKAQMMVPLVFDQTVSLASSLMVA